MNVVRLPVGNLLDVPAMCRKFADAVERGDHGEVSSVFLCAENGEGLMQFGWGEARDGLYHIGMLEWAKSQIMDAVRDHREDVD